MRSNTHLGINIHPSCNQQQKKTASSPDFHRFFNFLIADVIFQFFGHLGYFGQLWGKNVTRRGPGDAPNGVPPPPPIMS